MNLTCSMCTKLKDQTCFQRDKHTKTGYRGQCKDCTKGARVIRQTRYRKTQKGKETEARHKRKFKYGVMSVYSGGVPICACPGCGERHIEFLTIDHMNNDGAEHRRELGKGTRHCGGSMYHWLRKNNYPLGFQVLCFNCNCAKGLYGECPHVAESRRGAI